MLINFPFACNSKFCRWGVGGEEEGEGEENNLAWWSSPWRGGSAVPTVAEGVGGWVTVVQEEEVYNGVTVHCGGQ
jgi:hypothetical protein